MIQLLSWIKNIFISKPVDERIGQSYITEVLPTYHDRARTTNKTIWTIKKMITDDVAEVYRLESPSFTEHVDITKKEMITQDGVPIRFNAKGKLISYDPLFSRHGYAKGQLYSFERLGFLGDLDAIKKVLCVTDQYVLFTKLDSDTLYENTYQELDLLAPAKK